MAASDRIRAPLRANINRMPAEADSTTSTPEFVIRRNLILRKRSTSDSEERPPSFGSQSSSAVSNEAYKADGQFKKGVHLGLQHQQSSPRVSRDVALAPASHPASPWNSHFRTSSTKTHDVVLTSGGTLGLASKGGNMGEESSCDHVREDTAPRELIKTSETDPQEFRYGPGFVDKLKSRFISLSLQEKIQTPPVEGSMRRYSSLENVLEQDDYLDCAKRKRPIGNSLGYTNVKMPNLYVPARNSFKRAKSMETLLLESEHNMRHRNLSNTAFTNNNNNTNTNRLQRPLSACDPISGSVLINENLVIIETIQPKSVDLTSKISKKKTTTRQVSLSSINDEELPKPDIVKTCKLIFETASKRPVTHNSVRKAPVLRQSAKLQKAPPTQPANNQLINKVVQPSAAQPQHNGNLVSIAQQKFSAKENVVNGDVSPQPKDTATLQEKDVKVISNDALGRIRAQGTTMTFKGSQKGKPALSQAHTPKSTPTVKPSIPPPPPPIVVKAPEKAVVSKDVVEVESKQSTQNVEPVRPVSPPTLNGLSPAVVVVACSESERSMKTPNGVADIDDSKSGDQSSDETLSQDEDSEEQEILKPTALLSRSKPGGLWQKAPPPTNTVVYDFRGKEVKSHLPTNPAPFGCKPVKKAKKSSKSVSQVNGIDPSAILVLGDFGESKDYDDEDDDEDYDSDEVDVGAHLPVLSGITFVGENTKCTRSALLSTRNKKLKIRFVDNPKTFEYPASEEVEESVPNGDCGPPNGALPPSPTGEEEDAQRQSPAPSILRQNMAVTSSGGLSNYTPSMLSQSSESFQLGVERLVSEESPSSQSPPPDPSQSASSPDPASTNTQGKDELKPADPADMSSWSSSTSTSDLLF